MPEAVACRLVASISPMAAGSSPRRYLWLSL